MILEGVDSIMHPSIRGELADVVGFLSRLPTESPEKSKTKILCTSTTSADFLESIFQEDQILRMPNTSRPTSGLLRRDGRTA